MAKRSRVEIQTEDTELNMTPMLDVVFILLIFFIVTSVFVKTPGIEPNKPEATTAKEIKPGILVAVNGDDEVWIDKLPYQVNEVGPVVRALLEENPKAEGVILGDADAHAGVIMELQQLMTDLGIKTRVATK